MNLLNNLIKQMYNYWCKYPLWGTAHALFYVEYLDGKKSCRMTYKVATNYQEIFGGKVFEVDNG